MTYVKNNFLSLLILLCFAIAFFMFFKSCYKSPAAVAGTTTTIVHDTIWHQLSPAAPIQSQPIVISTQSPSLPVTNTIHEIIYKNDTAEISRILTQFFSKNNYKDVLKIDTIGTVTVTDTISQNTIAGRSYTYNLRYPVITNTVTIKESYKPVNQLYLGAGILGNQVDLVSAFKAGVLLKNKKDVIFEINATLNKGMNLGGEIGLYKKLSLKK